MYRTNKILIVCVSFDHLWLLFKKNNNDFQKYFELLFFFPFFLLFQFNIILWYFDIYGLSFSFHWPLPPSFLDILPFFLLLFFQTLTMSEQSERLINQYIDEINLLPLPTSFESRRRTLDLCYAIRLEYTRTVTSIARHKKALQSIVVLINILRKHPPSQIEE